MQHCKITTHEAQTQYAKVTLFYTNRCVLKRFLIFFLQRFYIYAGY